MDMKASEYFLSRRPDSGSLRPMYSRISYALYIHNEVTMRQLCKMPEKELEKIRNIGDKARAIIIEECRNYLQNCCKLKGEIKK